jgi:hypothetical protein
MAISSSADPVIASAAQPAGALRRPRVLVIAAAAGVAVLAIAAVVAAVLASPKDDPAPARFHAAGGTFSVVVPDGWRALRGRELRAMPTAPAAVLRRADGRAVVVVHERPALARSGRSLTRDLTAQLARRFSDLRPVTARTIALPGGPAYVYTFARPAAGRVQSLAVAPRAGRTYTLDAVARAGATDAAAQVGAILRSFDTTDPAPRS